MNPFFRMSFYPRGMRGGDVHPKPWSTEVRSFLNWRSFCVCGRRK